MENIITITRKRGDHTFEVPGHGTFRYLSIAGMQYIQRGAKLTTDTSAIIVSGSGEKSLIDRLLATLEE